MKQTDLEKLLADMSLKEKVDQMLQLSGAFYLGDENSVLTGPANDQRRESEKRTWRWPVPFSVQPVPIR